MIEAADLTEVLEAVARQKLGTNNVARVIVEPMADWTGEEAWRILIVLRDEEAVSHISGDAVIDNLMAIQEAINRLGDNRFGFVEYATEEELAAVDDSEC